MIGMTIGITILVICDFFLALTDTASHKDLAKFKTCASYVSSFGLCYSVTSSVATLGWWAIPCTIIVALLSHFISRTIVNAFHKS